MERTITKSAIGEFVFELATPADDAAIRRLLAHNPVPGRVTVTYEREPDYFLGCNTMGHFCQVLVARHRPSGKVVGVATRTIRALFVNGRVEEIGYIGQLRVDQEFQGRWVVSGGFRFFHQLHADGRVAGYITTIIEGNDQAQGVLVNSPRRHFPIYREVDRICTLALILRQSRFSSAFWPTRKGSGAVFEISHGSTLDLSAIVAFVRQHGAARQFFPAYSETDFIDSPVTLGFQIEDFILARRNGQLVGVMGLWDQSGYKQTVVRAYNASLRRLRLFYNIWAKLNGAQPLPPPDQPIHFVYGSFICIADNDPHIFQALLQVAYHLAAKRGYGYLMVGLSERDPLLAVARQYPHIPYYSRLYTVCWKDEVSFHEKLDHRLPHVEIAAL